MQRWGDWDEVTRVRDGWLAVVTVELSIVAGGAGLGHLQTVTGGAGQGGEP